jgi:hypothetical protein
MADAGIPPRAESCKISQYNWPEGRCASCKHWISGLSDFSDIAECRRNPPVRTDAKITGTLDTGSRKGARAVRSGAGRWPVTHGADACGEYAARG